MVLHSVEHRRGRTGAQAHPVGASRGLAGGEHRGVDVVPGGARIRVLA
jgi:hypothetical protein